MTSTQVVETSVTNNSFFQNYPYPDDHTIRTTDIPGLKPFTRISNSTKQLNPIYNNLVPDADWLFSLTVFNMLFHFFTQNRFS